MNVVFWAKGLHLHEIKFIFVFKNRVLFLDKQKILVRYFFVLSLLTLYHTILTYSDPEKEDCYPSVQKQITSFEKNISMSFANSHNMDEPKIFLCDKGLRKASYNYTLQYP